VRKKEMARRLAEVEQQAKDLAVDLAWLRADVDLLRMLQQISVGAPMDKPPVPCVACGADAQYRMNHKSKGYCLDCIPEVKNVSSNN